jgi:hypothetical protein
MATIKIKRGTSDPTAAQVTNIGELAANTSTPKLFIKTATDSSTTPVWIGATIEASPSDWTSTSKLATQSAINTTFMPKSGGTFTGVVNFGQGSTAPGEIRLLEDTDDGSNYSAFRGSARSANITYVMPTSDPTAGQVLSAGTPSSNISQLSWADASSATTVTTNSDNTNTTRYVVLSTSAQSGATLYVDDTTGPLSYNPSTAEMTVAGDLNVNGGDLKTSATTASLFDANATTITIGAAATSMTIGASTATINLGSGSTGATINVKGNLTVEGTTTTINSTTLTVDDKNIEIGSVATPSDTTADGGGITLKGATDKTIIWYDNSTTGIPADAWNSSEHFNIASGKAYYINGTSVLNGTTLGSGVTGSSLTSVGTLTSGTLGSGFTTVATSVGGTGLTSFTTNGAVYATSTSALTTGTLPVASGGTGITSFGSGVATFLGTPSSANLAAAVTDETGSGGLLVFNAGPTISTRIVAGTSSFDLINATATAVNFAGAATSLVIGATSGTTEIRNATLELGTTTATINTNSGSTNSLTVSPFGDIVLSPTSSTTLGGDRPSIRVHNDDNAAGTVDVTGGDLYLGTKTDGVATVTPVNIIFEGTTADGFETTLTLTDPTSDRTITLPNATGTVITTGNLTSITATGTISSGVWNGTAIGAAYGGTGQTTYTTGDILYASGSTAISKLSASSTAGAVLASTGSGAAPEYKTISLTNGSVTSGSGTLTLAIQNAAADGSTKGIAAFNSTDFDAASGVISIDTVDGGTY